MRARARKCCGSCCFFFAAFVFFVCPADLAELAECLVELTGRGGSSCGLEGEIVQTFVVRFLVDALPTAAVLAASIGFSLCLLLIHFCFFTVFDLYVYHVRGKREWGNGLRC